MFAVLAEDSSDAEPLSVLVERISGLHVRKAFQKGFNGCGKLRRKAPAHIKELSRRGVTRFIVCESETGTHLESETGTHLVLTSPIGLGVSSVLVFVPVQAPGMRNAMQERLALGLGSAYANQLRWSFSVPHRARRSQLPASSFPSCVLVSV